MGIPFIPLFSLNSHYVKVFVFEVNTDQENAEYEHFLHSVSFVQKIAITRRILETCQTSMMELFLQKYLWVF